MDMLTELENCIRLLKAIHYLQEQQGMESSIREIKKVLNHKLNKILNETIRKV